MFCSHLKGLSLWTYSLNLLISSTSNLSQEWPGVVESTSKFLESCSKMELTRAVALLFLSMVSSVKFPPRVLNQFLTLATIHSQTMSSLLLFKSLNLNLPSVDYFPWYFTKCPELNLSLILSLMDFSLRTSGNPLWTYLEAVEWNERKNRMQFCLKNWIPSGSPDLVINDKVFSKNQRETKRSPMFSRSSFVSSRIFSSVLSVKNTVWDESSIISSRKAKISVSLLLFSRKNAQKRPQCF